MSGFPVEFLDLQSWALRRQHGSCCVAGVEAGEVWAWWLWEVCRSCFSERTEIGPHWSHGNNNLTGFWKSHSKKPPRRQRDYFCSVGRYHWLRSMTKLRHWAFRIQNCSQGCNQTLKIARHGCSKLGRWVQEHRWFFRIKLLIFGGLGLLISGKTKISKVLTFLKGYTQLSHQSLHSSQDCKITAFRSHFERGWR